MLFLVSVVLHIVENNLKVKSFPQVLPLGDQKTSVPLSFLQNQIALVYYKGPLDKQRRFTFKDTKKQRTKYSDFATIEIGTGTLIDIISFKYTM